MKYYHLLLLPAAILLLTAMKPKKSDHFMFVPSGEFVRDDVKKTVQGFYMASTEVTNAQYRMFLQDIAAQSQTADLEVVQVNSENWEGLEEYSKPLAETYATHDAYEDYPVVNISFAAAQLYCKWLSKKMQEQSGLDGIVVRLPKQTEWTYAACGGRDLAHYPWGGFYIKNSKGCYLLNMQAEPEDDNAWATCKADAYFPNDYGLYNMSGNVAEMIDSEGEAMGGSWRTKDYKQVRVDSKSTYQEASPDLGFRPILTYTGAETKNRFDPNKIWKKLAKNLDM